MTLKPHEQALHESHRAALLRASADHPEMVRELARRQGVSTRAVYRVLEGDVAGKIWLPRLVGELAGVEAFAGVSGADALGYVVAAPPSAETATSRDLALAAVRLGGDAGLVQRLLLQAMEPDSPGGERIVGSEELAIRGAVATLRRGIVALERLLDASSAPPAARGA